MVFSSLLFLFTFFPIVLIAYFAVKRVSTKGKWLCNLVLFVSSLIFYAWGEPVYVVIMLFSTLVDFTHGLLVERFMEQGRTKAAKLTVASSMIINLALLGFFKYSDFLISNINGISGGDIPLLNLVLPIGISFYTFQTMSYTVDVYRGQAKASHNIISFGAYVALFPQLIAGPIVQYKTVAGQLVDRRESPADFGYGASRFMLGLGKKVLLANNIGYLWDSIQGMDLATMPVLTAWLGIIAFAFQIYFDFSGYSDMAIGLGRIFGFTFLENFNYPYMSISITDFWRRWHISLGSWFREYVYIPMGGNRCGKLKQLRNILVVWLLTGIWHGASWNFVLWGVYFGILLIIEKLFLLKLLEKAPQFIKRIYTLSLVLFSWVIFAFDDTARGLGFLSAMFGQNGAGFANGQSGYLLYSNLLLLIILGVAATPAFANFAKKLLTAFKRPALVEVIKSATLFAVFILSLAYLVDASYNPFLYFRF